MQRGKLGKLTHLVRKWWVWNSNPGLNYHTNKGLYPGNIRTLAPHAHIHVPKAIDVHFTHTTPYAFYLYSWLSSFQPHLGAYFSHEFQRLQLSPLSTTTNPVNPKEWLPMWSQFVQQKLNRSSLKCCKPIKTLKLVKVWRDSQSIWSPRRLMEVQTSWSEQQS